MRTLFDETDSKRKYRVRGTIVFFMDLVRNQPDLERMQAAILAADGRDPWEDTPDEGDKGGEKRPSIREMKHMVVSDEKKKGVFFYIYPCASLRRTQLYAYETYLHNIALELVVLGIKDVKEIRAELDVHASVTHPCSISL